MTRYSVDVDALVGREPLAWVSHSLVNHVIIIIIIIIEICIFLLLFLKITCWYSSVYIYIYIYTTNSHHKVGDKEKEEISFPTFSPHLDICARVQVSLNRPRPRRSCSERAQKYNKGKIQGHEQKNPKKPPKKRHAKCFYSSPFIVVHPRCHTRQPRLHVGDSSF